MINMLGRSLRTALFAKGGVILALAAKNGTVRFGDGEMEYIRFGTGEKDLVLLPGLGDGLRTMKGTALPMGVMYRKWAEDYTVWSFSRRNELPQGFTTREIGTMLGIPYQTVISRLKTAHAKLRMALTDSDTEGGAPT